jgi:integrase
VIRVERSWDAREGVIETKSGAGRRKVPLAAVLRGHLEAERRRQGRSSGYVFRTSRGAPIWTSSLSARAKTRWTKAGLTPIRLHECRHTFASMMIAAEVNAKALSTYMGHASITITLDRYGHLMPGSEDEAAAQLDAYLAAA